MKGLPQVAPEKLTNYFSYDEDTGKLFWKKKTGDKVIIGKEAGHKNKRGHVSVRFFGKLYLAHRLIWAIVKGHWPEKQIDHDDKNPSNNRWDNLREATNQQNSFNKKSLKNSSSKYLGVCWVSARSKWKAAGTKDNKTKHLGLFINEREAALAYNKFAEENYGEFASLNLVDFVDDEYREGAV